MAMFQVEVSVVTPCSVVRGYFTLKTDAAWAFETLVYYHNTARRHNSEDIYLN
jgi:hypothetical protein